MSLRKLTAHNFRLLENFGIEFGPRVTVLVGPNYVGKSTVLEALLFLRNVKASLQLYPTLGAMMGDFTSAASSHDQSRMISLQISVTDAQASEFTYCLEFNREALQQEAVTAQGNLVSEARREGTEIHYFRDGALNSRATANINASLQPLSDEQLAPLQHFFSTMVNVDPFRNVSARSSVGNKETIAPTGADLSQVLHYHYNNDRERFDAYEEAVRRVLQEVDMIETPIAGQMTTARIRFRGSPVKFELAALSSGIREILTLVAAAQFSQPGSLILVEEPENHLHPAAQKALCAVFQELAEREGKQFVLTTHSEFIFGQFPPAQSIFIDRAGSGSQATPLENMDVHSAWQRLGIDRGRLLEVLGRARQVVVVTEARADARVVDALVRDIRDLSDKVLPVGAEGGGWNEIIAYAAQLRDALGRFRIPSTVLVLLDSDDEPERKRQCLVSHGFDERTSHVWREKEIESYLIIPQALAAICGNERPAVEAVIAQAKGNGKGRLRWVLDQLGIADTPLDVIVTNACRSGHLPPEFVELVAKLEALF
jgi:predicted ATPase